MSAVLNVVPLNDGQAPKHETVAARVRRLQAEARQLARDHIAELTAAMAHVHQLANEVAEGGEAYPAGVRDLARRVAEDLDLRVQTVEAISERVI